MAQSDIEIELKFPLDNQTLVIDFLNNQGVLQKKDVWQKDIYFTPAHRDFLAPDYPFEWLRLRETAKAVSLGYKHFYPENAKKTNYCDEFQTIVGDAGAIKKILSSLNFSELAVVEKIRSTWLYKDVDVSIDNVTNLGSYIELEAMRHDGEPKAVKNYLYSILKEIQAEVGEEDLRGYPYRLLEKNGKLKN